MKKVVRKLMFPFINAKNSQRSMFSGTGSFKEAQQTTPWKDEGPCICEMQLQANSKES
jgi:hypothetical protein